MEQAAWSDQAHGAQPSVDDDFHQFLNMNNMENLPEGLPFDFGDFQSQIGGHMMQAPHRETLDTPMSGTDASLLLSTAMHSQVHPMTTAPSNPTIPSNMVAPPTPRDTISDIDAQIQYLQQQKLQQQQRRMEEQHVAFFAQQQAHMAPPTPQSLEIQPGSHQFYTQQANQTPHQHQDVYEPFQGMQEQQQQQQDMSFTPLVSPAVTPLDSQFPMDQHFAVPNAYFSPLTSPALHAQSDSMMLFDMGLSATTSSSPERLETEANVPPTPAHGSGDAAKKPKKAAAAKTRTRVSVGKSPIAKPQRKKTGSTPLMNAQTLSELAETADKRVEPRAQASTKPRLAASNTDAFNSITAIVTDSENNSVSPETLSEMPPPPLPKSRSAKPSPYLQPQGGSTPTVAPAVAPRPTGKPSPATPASLMRLPSPRNANKSSAPSGSDSMTTDGIESLELPEAVSLDTLQMPALEPLNTQSPQLRSPAVDPRSGGTSALQPLPSPVLAKPGAAAAATQSPQIAPGSSSTTPNLRKTPQLTPRNNNKRGSVSSTHASPGLRPRASPSIKPLLPSGGTAEDTASKLLASKSNYQNILEGNVVPGVSYPSELSTNLTSKRTSHKIAEQGRRNRINLALQEMATLLPRGLEPEGKDNGGESGETHESKATSTPNSKASTVEQAIDYIKQLKKEIEDANKRADEAEKRLQGTEATISS